MSIIRFLALLGCLLSVGCGGVAISSTRPTADTRTWKTYRVQVDDQIVQFTVPPGESGDYPVFNIPQRLDLGGRGVFDEIGLGPYLLRRHWEYRSSRFVHADGGLHANIGLRRSEHSLIGDDALKTAVIENNLRFEETDGVVPEAQNVPIQFYPLTIGERSWIRVRYRLSGYEYVTPLDDRNYIEVSISVGGFTRQDWRADAEAAANVILQSIRIFPLQ